VDVVAVDFVDAPSDVSLLVDMDAILERRLIGGMWRTDFAF
jgi:hypothetical protein